MQDYTGKVKWFDRKKGYGFILNQNDTDDIFVHFSSIQIKGFKELYEGDVVKFDLIETERGLLALNVKRIKCNLENILKEKKKKMANLK